MDFTRLTTFIDGLEKLGIQGCDMGVEIGGKYVYRHMAGFADKEQGRRMQGNELYFMYSMSKVVTCAAALTLFEQGKFLIDDPISEYIPEFRDMMVRHVKKNGEETLLKAENPITFKNLFTMTSGLDYNTDEPHLLAAIERTGGRAPTVEMVKAIAQRPLQFEPGTQFLYSLSHDVLAALVEIISGERFGEYVRKVIFEPCGMVDSSYLMPTEKLDRLARLYEYSEEGKCYVPAPNKNYLMLGTEYESGGAGLISTLDDYMKFARMMTNHGITDDGKRILSSRTIDLMRMDHLTPMGLSFVDWPHFLGYSYGLGVRTMADKTMGGSLSPVGEFGWGGLAGSYVLIDPENDLTAVYTQHEIPSQEPYIHRRLRNILYSCLD